MGTGRAGVGHGCDETAGVAKTVGRLLVLSMGLVLCYATRVEDEA